MVEVDGFKKWLSNNFSYSKPVVRDICSRMKRADNFLYFENDEIYLYRLEQLENYRLLSSSVRSQIKKSVKLYQEYMKAIDNHENNVIEF